MKGLYHDAMAIWLRDLPVVPLTQAPALVPFNSTYWQGWPTADNAWNMPVSWWATFNLVLTGYPNATGGWVPAPATKARSRRRRVGERVRGIQPWPAHASARTESDSRWRTR